MTAKPATRFASALAELKEARAEAFARHVAPIDAAIAGLQALTPAPPATNGHRPRAVKATRTPRNGRPVKKAKPMKRGRRAELTEAGWEKAVRQCLRGESVAAVARELGVGYGALYPRVAAARKTTPGKSAKKPAKARAGRPTLASISKEDEAYEGAKVGTRRVCKACGEWTSEDPCSECLEPAE